MADLNLTALLGGASQPGSKQAGTVTMPDTDQEATVMFDLLIADNATDQADTFGSPEVEVTAPSQDETVLTEDQAERIEIETENPDVAPDPEAATGPTLQTPVTAVEAVVARRIRTPDAAGTSADRWIPERPRPAVDVVVVKPSPAGPSGTIESMVPRDTVVRPSTDQSKSTHVSLMTETSPRPATPVLTLAPAKAAVAAPALVPASVIPDATAQVAKTVARDMVAGEGRAGPPANMVKVTTASTSMPAVAEAPAPLQPNLIAQPRAADALHDMAARDIPLEEIAAPRSSGSAQPIAAGTGHTLTAPPLARNVAGQVAIAVTQSGPGTTELALNPPELGKVRLTLTAQDTGIILMVQAERPETGDLMRRHIDTLAQEFANIGFGDIQFAFADGAGSDPKQAETDGDIVPAAAMSDPSDDPLDMSRHMAGQGGLDLRL